MKLLYAHQVRPESDCLPFEFRQAEIKIKVLPPDYVGDFCETYQVMHEDKAFSDPEINIDTALSTAAIELCWQSRKLFNFN